MAQAFRLRLWSGACVPRRGFDVRRETRETRDVHKDVRCLDKETELITCVAANGLFKSIRGSNIV